jgi:hypothetical protein
MDDVTVADLHREHEGQSGVFPARLLLPTERATVAQLTNAAKERAPDPAVFEEHSPVFWTAEASSNRVDAYATFMSTGTLKNFAEDAKRGVSFQDSHLTDGLVRTLGQSVGARYIGPNAQARPEGIAAVEIDFYTLLGLDPTIDTFVRKAQTGLTRDVSVGFYGGWYRCTICDRDMRDYSDWNNYCPHYPGQKVAILDPKTGKATAERAVATAEIMDAHLAEVSSVYDGATEGAGILFVKARELADAGKLDPKEARFIEDRYRVRLPGMAPAWGVGIDLRTGTPGQRREVPGQRATPQEGTMTFEEQVRALLAEHGVAESADPLAHIRGVLGDQQSRIQAATAARDEQVRGALASLQLPCEGEDLLAAIRGHGDGLAALRKNADYGKRWHEQLIAEAEAEGVRALGDKFTEQRKAALKGLSPEDLIERRDTWREMGDIRNPGGRLTTDEPLGGGAPQKAPVPLSAYRQHG